MYCRNCFQSKIGKIVPDEIDIYYYPFDSYEQLGKHIYNEEVLGVVPDNLAPLYRDGKNRKRLRNEWRIS
jgi:hypothetical protein